MARILTQETSLSLKRQSLIKESGFLGKLMLVELVLGGLLASAGLVVHFTLGSSGLLWTGVILAAIGGGHFLKLKQNRREERHVQWGLEGERRVTGILDERLDNSHYIINDFKVMIGRRSAQIDHLVISPRGMFAIETKNWAGHIEGDENEDTWTQQSRDGDRPPMKRYNPIKQVERHVEFLNDKLAKSGIIWPDVKGVVVFNSPKATHYVHHATMEILTPAEAADAISRFKGSRTYSDEEVSAVVNLFMR